MLASLAKAKNDEAAEHIARDLDRCTPEEIWFWTSNYPGSIRRYTQSEKVIEALTVLAS